MIWSWLTGRDRESRADAMRRTHSRFLSAALGHESELPRIPVRRVDRGGFGPLMARARGRRAAEEWWSRAFARLPDTGDE